MIALYRTALHFTGYWSEYYMLKQARSPKVNNRFYQTIRELVNFGQSDPLALSIYNTTPLHEFIGPVEALQFLAVQQQAFDIDLESSRLGLKIAQALSSFVVNVTDSIRFLLGDGPIPLYTIQERFGSGTLLTYSARRLTFGFQHSVIIYNQGTKFYVRLNPKRSKCSRTSWAKCHVSGSDPHNMAS